MIFSARLCYNGAAIFSALVCIPAERWEFLYLEEEV
jgi:hypothetical protein